MVSRVSTVVVETQKPYAKCIACDVDKVQGKYFKTPLKWANIVFITLAHLLTLWALLTFPYFYKLKTFFYGICIGGVGGFGVTAGAHRLWTHRTYKAKLPLRILLAACYSSAGQNSIFQWVRDHRVHHKFSETDADPHNSNRGFFFAHVGWLMMQKHDDVICKGKQVDMSDVLADPVVRFQEKYFVPMKLFFCFILPALIPRYCWGESWYWSILGMSIARYILLLNFTWLVNSAAHLYGNKPYNRKINPRENLTVAFLAMGEGWHNYHHTFPWDYKASEIGRMNITTFWINMFAKLGWAYDLKQASDDLVRRVIQQSGDGSYKWGEEVPESERFSQFPTE